MHTEKGTDQSEQKTINAIEKKLVYTNLAAPVRGGQIINSSSAPHGANPILLSIFRLKQTVISIVAHIHHAHAVRV